MQGAKIKKLLYVFWNNTVFAQVLGRKRKHTFPDQTVFFSGKLYDIRNNIANVSKLARLVYFDLKVRFVNCLKFARFALLVRFCLRVVCGGKNPLIPTGYKTLNVTELLRRKTPSAPYKNGTKDIWYELSWIVSFWMYFSATFT